MIQRALLLRALPAQLCRLPSVQQAHGRPISTACHLTDDQHEFQKVARDFARKELLPHASEWDEKKHFPIDTLRAAAELGFGGLYIREDVGGSALGRADAAVIFEELAYGDVTTTAYLTIHNMVSHCIDRYGTEKQRQQYLPHLVTMDKLASYCLTEPNSGSDAASLTATAKRDGGSFLLSGSKAFISGGGASDVYLVMARTGAAGPKGISAFLVDKGTPGLSFGKQEAKTGWNAQPTCTVNLDAVCVPAEAMLGREGQGFSIAMNALNGGRINIGACSLGGAAFCLDAAQEHAAVRKQFGQPIGSFQAIQFKLADMATCLHSARLMVRHAAESLDMQAPSATLDAAMAKRHATEAGCHVADDAMQVFGGYGYLKEYKVERVWRDLRVHRLLEGTNEIMNVIIARELMKQ
ncbi:Isobutyryl-CoA dehydrogenase, mitochondrial [Coccomyxa viridis]|uniref:Isobutyryl-CoA dehydrogenase, mitochondrial n=1 Tax=Coccomyxa viridis TaxID=1274662 RepID=A0AAV1IJJ6_9CHLO|nr:Isobutyryl-CoA dehydrogenase, mitochondrial [Coccomyxa viridis]